MTFSDMYVDYMVSSVLLRNNPTIPTKYHTKHPVWVYDRHAPWAASITALEGNLTALNDCAYWSDSLEGIPVGRLSETHAGLLRWYDWSLAGDSNSQNDTLTPIWPKIGSNATAMPFSNGPGINNLGSWANPDTKDAWTYTSDSYMSTPLVHQCEDLASFVYSMPIFSDASSNVYGTSDYVSSVALTVTRGDWVFKVVQFIPDSSNGTYIESADIPVVVSDDVFTLPSTWSGGTPQTVNINFSTISTSTTTSVGTTSTTGFQQQCHGTDWRGVNVWYFPRLVCVNRKNHDHGSYRNVYPRECIYSGYLTMQATVV
jgi:hypothetical protein